MSLIHLFDRQHVHIVGLPFTNQTNLNRFAKDDLTTITQENEALDFLSYHLAGGSLFFQTNAKELHFEVLYHQEPLMNHMSPLGESGFDIYLLKDETFVFYDSIRPFPRQKKIQISLKLPPSDQHVIMMHTPQYARLEHAFVKIDDHEDITPYDPKYTKRIFFYGTSITQGACASRPGMSYTNQLARLLKYEVINMGFSGNRLGELSVAAITHKIDLLDMIVIDYEANAGAVGKLKQTLIPFIECIRRRHKYIPIVIIGRIPFTRELFNQEDYLKRKDHLRYQQEVSKIQHLQPLHFINGEQLIWKDEYDVTVDGIHLNDLGMTLYAQRLAPRLSHIMNQ